MDEKKASVFEPFRQALVDHWRFITFRADAELFDRIGLPHFLIGFITTWLVGIGRNWDFPDAPLFAKTGLPSVAYIFILSFVLFLTSWPVSTERLNYWKILTLVSMTAAPGLVYAIPVEAMFPLPVAQQINLWFLGIVATWRVGLAILIFMKAAENSAALALAILLMPICLIILGLVYTGRAEFVMELMGGVNRPENVNTGVNGAISVMFCLAWPTLIVAAVMWIAAAITIRLGDRLD